MNLWNKKKLFVQKRLWIKKRFWSVKLGPHIWIKDVRLRINLDPKFFLSCQKCWYKKMLDPIKCGSKIWRPNKCLGPKKFLGPTFGSKGYKRSKKLEI